MKGHRWRRAPAGSKGGSEGQRPSSRSSSGLRVAGYRDPGLRIQVRSARAQGARDATGRLLRPLQLVGGRPTVIRDFRVGWEVAVPNGRGLVRVSVQPARVGRRLGQFAASKVWYRAPVVKAAKRVKKGGKVKK